MQVHPIKLTRPPWLFPTFQAMFCDISSSVSKNYISTIFEAMQNDFWSIGKIPQQTYSQFKQKIFWLKVIIVGFYLIMCISCPSAIFCGWYPSWYFLSNISNLTRTLLMLFYAVMFIGTSIECYLHVFIPIFVALNLNVQMVILVAYFESIACEVEQNAACDQACVRNRLLFGIKQHKALKR